MSTDEAVRTALTDRVALVVPDVEVALAGVRGRARRRRGTRRTLYAAGLAAAVVVSAVVLNLPADPVEPAEPDEPARSLTPGRGMFDDPAAVAPGRWTVRFLSSAPAVAPTAEIDIPKGWSQDDDVALATGPPGASTRRLDFFAGDLRVYPDPCAPRHVDPGPGVLDLVGALTGVEGVRVSPARPVTLGDGVGYVLRLARLTSAEARTSCSAGRPRFLRLPPAVEAFPMRPRGDLVWIVEHDGRRLVIVASHGPDVTRAQIEELQRMVSSMTLTSD